MFKKIGDHVVELFFIVAAGALATYMTISFEESFLHPVAIFTWVAFVVVILVTVQGAKSSPDDGSVDSAGDWDDDENDKRHNVTFRGAGYPFTDINTPDD